MVLLNLAGVVTGKPLRAYRPWIIIGTFIFAAVATPSADPFTMTCMAVPMVRAVLRLRDDRPRQRPARGRGEPNAGLVARRALAHLTTL